jgi:hypothetical protein
MGDSFGKLLQVQVAHVCNTELQLATLHDAIKSSKMYHAIEQTEKHVAGIEQPENIYIKRKRRKISHDNDDSGGIDPRMPKVDLTKTDFADGILDDIGVRK